MAPSQTQCHSQTQQYVQGKSWIFTSCDLVLATVELPRSCSFLSCPEVCHVPTPESCVSRRNRLPLTTLETFIEHLLGEDNVLSTLIYLIFTKAEYICC